MDWLLLTSLVISIFVCVIFIQQAASPPLPLSSMPTTSTFLMKWWSILSFEASMRHAMIWWHGLTYVFHFLLSMHQTLIKRLILVFSICLCLTSSNFSWLRFFRLRNLGPIAHKPSSLYPYPVPCVQQDLFSFNKEQAIGDTHNMIPVIMNEQGCDLQTAVDMVGELCRQSIDRFVEDWKNLPSWGPEIDRQVQSYVQGLADWIVGSLYWSYESERYFGKTGLEVKKNRVVNLLPPKF